MPASPLGTKLLLSAAVLLACGGRATQPEPARPVLVSIPSQPAEEPSDERSPAPDRRPGSYTTASGLGVEELRLGTGDVAEPGKRVELHYVGMLPDGTVFDSSRERHSPMTVELGKGYLIKGFEEGITGMRVGGLRRLTIPPTLGYGERALAKIPAGSTLLFEVELLAIR